MGLIKGQREITEMTLIETTNNMEARVSCQGVEISNAIKSAPNLTDGWKATFIDPDGEIQN